MLTNDTRAEHFHLHVNRSGKWALESEDLQIVDQAFMVHLQHVVPLIPYIVVAAEEQQCV